MKSIDEILAKYSDRSDLIDVLEEIQETFGYVSEENMLRVEQALKTPLIDVYGVVTFYSAFKLKPPGKHTIKICRGTACHVRRSDAVLGHVEETLDVKAGDTTKNGKFTLETVNCIGACAKAPAMMIDDMVFGELTKGKIDGILRRFK